jgi:hypothetical protein
MRILFALCSALWLALLAPSAMAQDDVAAFYKDKTIRLIVGVAVGSGYDINARALARHMGAHIPGNPQIIVQNQPGAGSLTMTNTLYSSGPFDGTVIGAPFNGLPTAPLLQGFASIRRSSTGSAAPIARPTSRTCGRRRPCRASTT